MAAERQNKRRQKEMVKEWKGVSTQYAKNLKLLEDSVSKAGTYFILQGEQEKESLPGVQNDDIVIWQQHISRGQEQINGSIVNLREIIKEHKKMTNYTKAGKVSLKRKTPTKLIKLEELLRHLQDYATLVDSLAHNIPPTERLIGLGNTRVVSGDLEEASAEKLREELVALNARWNRVNEKVLRYVDRCENLVLEISNNYKALKVWMVKSDNMLQWLTECENLLQKESKIASDRKSLEGQYKDNEEFMQEGREYQPSAIEVLTSGDKIYNQARLDKYDLQYVNQSVIALRNRWNAIEEHLETRDHKIKILLKQFKKKDSNDELEPWRKKAQNLNNSLNNSQNDLDAIDARLNEDNKYETLKHCTQEIQKIELNLLNETSEEITEVSSSGAAWQTKQELSPDDRQEVNKTVIGLHDKMSGLEENVMKQKERVQRSSSNLIGQSVTDCEQSLNQLDKMSLENFSAVGSDVQQVQKQIKDMQVFEEKLVAEETKFQQITKQYEDATSEGMLDNNSKTKIVYQLKELERRYKELWTEHEASKQRILKGLLDHSNDVIYDAENWLNDAESRATSIGHTDGVDKIELEKKLADQEILIRQTKENEPKVRTAVVLGKTILKDETLGEQQTSFTSNDIDRMENRLEKLKIKNLQNEQRLKNALNSFTEVIPVEHAQVAEVPEDKHDESDAPAVNETVEIGEAGNGLESGLPDDLFSQPKDEGFHEEPTSSPTEDLEMDFGQKMSEFKKELDGMNTWISDSDKLCDDFYKNMHDKEAWKIQDKIEKRYDDLEKKQKNVDHIYELGKEVTSQSSDEDTNTKIHEEMFEMNSKWTECTTMLTTACEVQVQRAKQSSKGEGCNFMTILRRKFGTMCMYNW